MSYIPLFNIKFRDFVPKPTDVFFFFFFFFFLPRNVIPRHGEEKFHESQKIRENEIERLGDHAS